MCGVGNADCTQPLAATGKMHWKRDWTCRFFDVFAGGLVEMCLVAGADKPPEPHEHRFFAWPVS